MTVGLAELDRHDQRKVVAVHRFPDVAAKERFIRQYVKRGAATYDHGYLRDATPAELAEMDAV